MTHNTPTLDPRAARNAGALYLAIAVCGGFSIAYVPSQIVVAGDAAASATNLMAQAGLFKLGVLADSAVILFELAITVILFGIFRPVSPLLSMFAAVARAGMIMVMAINLLLWVMPYAVLTSPMGFEQAQAEMLAQTFLDAHALGVFVWQIFFGAHLLALGWLILRSRIVPHVLGWGLAIGALGYLLQGLVRLTFTESATLDAVSVGLLTIVSISEISFGLWLLFRGARKSKSHPIPA